MIIHWRAHLNSVQNAVGYMIKPSIIMMFGGPTAAAAVERYKVESVSVTDYGVTVSVTDPGITVAFTDPDITVEEV